MMPRQSPAEALKSYSEKRNFAVTSEPKGIRGKSRKALSFVIQKHWASRLHYDFRLEWDGVMLSWAVPRGPSLDPKEKRMAVHVEDHPVSYASFEGSIPKGEYGAGNVIVWDNGTWEPIGNPTEAMTAGKLIFKLHGQKLAGLWELVNISKDDSKKDQWILFKKRDEWAVPKESYDVISALPDSVIAQPLGLLEARKPAPAVNSASPITRTPADLAGAAECPLPEKMSPQLATLTKGSPPPGEWSYEIKFDGYRIMARLEHGNVKLFTRGGHDWTAKMKGLARGLAELEINSAWLDGEVVVLDESGKPNFNNLQNAFDAKNDASLTYFLFDVPFFEGYDLTKVPLHARRELLKAILNRKALPQIQFSEDFSADANSLVQSACALGLEGIIAKRRDSPYVSARTGLWLKLKCNERQEFVILGYTDRAGAKGEVGGLLLGYYHHDTLHYAGNVGTGWNSKVGSALHEKLSKIRSDSASVDPITIKPGRWSRRNAEAINWVRPSVVAEVSFAEWTPDGHVRHAVFQGLRSDKPASRVVRETPVEQSTRTRETDDGRIGLGKISNPDRVIDASTGITKLALVRYYESVAEWMIPHLRGRPVSLVRAPNGVEGQQFFQKHDDAKSIPGLSELDPGLWPGHPALLEVNTPQALVNAAQMNVVEFHPWNSTSKRLEKPDRIIFDLDPGQGVAWALMPESAILIRALLNELGLASWVKTSGGKGLHVVVPIAPRLSFDIVKAFSQAVVQHLAATIPSRFVSKSGPSNRMGKIFVDYLRNGFGQTTAAAFSARARAGLGVSMPIDWEQLSELKSGAQWSIVTAREYLSFQKVDPWISFWSSQPTLSKPMKILGFNPKTISK